VDKDLPGRNGKSVVDIFFNNVKSIGEGLNRHNSQYFLANLVYIAHDGRVGHQFIALTHDFHELAGQFFLFLDGDGHRRSAQHRGDRQTEGQAYGFQQVMVFITIHNHSIIAHSYRLFKPHVL
jgi:hypothetical protein